MKLQMNTWVNLAFANVWVGVWAYRKRATKKVWGKIKALQVGNMLQFDQNIASRVMMMMIKESWWMDEECEFWRTTLWKKRKVSIWQAKVRYKDSIMVHRFESSNHHLKLTSLVVWAGYFFHSKILKPPFQPNTLPPIVNMEHGWNMWCV